MPAPELEAEVIEESPATTPKAAEEQEAEEPIQESKAEATTEPLAAVPDAEGEQEPEELETPVESSEPQAEATPQEPESQDDRDWYVVHCYSGHENKVKHNLEQRIETMQLHERIFQIVVPTEDEIEVRDGKRRTVERRVFPGYILVQMTLDDDSWYAVRNTPGVTGFVGMGNRPAPLRPEEVQAILKRMEADAPKIKVTFKPGQKVRIIEGPFNEFIGVVSELNMERAKVQVLISFFGRETPVELDFLQVEKT
ncbi:MAG: transcription termination/antitermination protein NusG [Chloroflexi bacterium]|nr:transcription termination/antitermination protein NusG [Chloroflexota bacterium]